MLTCEMMLDVFLSHKGDEDQEIDSSVITKNKTKKPPKYKVILHNDDYSTMEFVISVLMKFFGKGAEEAAEIMLKVHNEGAGICGVYSYEVAETKVFQVVEFAKNNKQPLKCTMEEE